MKSLAFLGLTALAVAETVTYDWTASRLDASPDGYTRSVIGINGAWPCPAIEASLGDEIVVNLTNGLANETITMHFHGIAQHGTPQMDGPAYASQCPIPPGYSFQYKFTVNQTGTYWWHDHNAHYPDGLRGPLIIYDPADPFAGQYDEELVLSVSDWYHDQAATLIAETLSPSNTNFSVPLPDSALIGEAQNVTYTMDPNKTYKVRVISFAAFAGMMLEFQDHTMNIIEVDGTYTEMYSAEQIRVAPAQRYSFLLAPKSNGTTSTSGNFAILGALDTNQDFTAPDPTWATNTSAFLVYSDNSTLPAPLVVDAFDSVLDDTDLTPLDGEALLPTPDNTIVIDFNFGFDTSGDPRAFFNNETYVDQDVPTLYTAMTSGPYATDSEIYGQVNPFILSQGQTVEIIFNNLDGANHPLHLHGHNFQVVERPPSNSSTYSGGGTEDPVPIRRDTVVVMANSYLVIRFTANNPGVWLFHCHIEWHVAMGMSASMIEAPLALQNLTIPADGKAACLADGLSYKGNAAGNTQNLTNLTGAPTDPTASLEKRSPLELFRVPRSPSKALTL